jgi:hypothetical protein
MPNQRTRQGHKSVSKSEGYNISLLHEETALVLGAIQWMKNDLVNAKKKAESQDNIGAVGILHSFQPVLDSVAKRIFDQATDSAIDDTSQDMLRELVQSFENDFKKLQQYSKMVRFAG